MGRKISKEKAKELMEKSKLKAIKDLLDSDDYTLFTYKEDSIVKWKAYVGDIPIESMLEVLNESISEGYRVAAKQIKENKRNGKRKT